MTAATHSFMSSDILGTPGFFTAAIAGDESVNPFEASFKAGNASFEYGHERHSRLDESQNPDVSSFTSSAVLQSMKSDGYSPLFAFSPRASPAPYDHRHATLSHPTTVPQAPRRNTKRDKQIGLGLQTSNQYQALSPPSSVKHSPEQWQFNDPPQPMFSPIHQILTQDHGQQTRTEYGQVTPPDDRTPKDFGHPDGEFDQQEMEGIQASLSTTASKRKRGALSSTSSAPADRNPGKRQRKLSSRSKYQSLAVNGTSIESVEDAKRSKFLERNRVAASKCRQKKKEWTSNLETRARELQNSKNQLSVMVGSLKEEVLFLKGELLKHSTCGCARIREYLNREVATMSNSGYKVILPEGKASPVDSASSKTADPDDGNGKCEEFSDDDESATSPIPDQHDANRISDGQREEKGSQFDGGDEEKLETLLSAQLGHGTSDE